MTDLIKLLEELLSLGSYPLNSIADPLVNKILSHPACNDEITKQVKQAVQREVGWLLVGLDFASLEDKISALTTKDENKLKVYTDEYDGHSLRAFSYFGDQMPDIEVAPQNATCYIARVGDTDIYFHADETIEYLGKTMKGSGLYELLTSTGI